MTKFSVRQLNLAGFIACAGMMAFAIYAERIMLLMPCPLCVLERMAVVALGIVLLVIALGVNALVMGLRMTGARYAYA